MKRSKLLAKVLAFSLAALIPVLLIAQPAKKIRKVVEVMPQQTFYLNGGARSMFGGVSRQVFTIDIPKNTVEWYYSYTTTEGTAPSSASIKLASQLTRLIDPTGLTAIATSAILCPTGSNSCDGFLIGDHQNAQAFINKDDNLGGSFRYYAASSRANFRDGTIQVQGLNNGRYYLGFKNPSASTGVTVAFEVAAIVEEMDPNYEKAVNYGNLGWKAYESGDIDRSILYSKKALELDADLIFVKTNLGLCYLIKKDEIAATDLYMDALTGIRKLTQSSEKKYYLDAAIQDIREAAIKYGRLSGSDEIIDMYNQELTR